MPGIKTLSQKGDKHFTFTNLITHPLVIISVLLSVGTMVGITILRDAIPPEVPLFYGLPEGEEQIAPQNLFYLPSLLALTFTVINIALATLFDNKYPQRVLIITGFAASIFASITTLQIIRLVGSF